MSHFGDASCHWSGHYVGKVDIRVLIGLVLAFVGGFFTSLTAQIDVRRSRRPKVRRYAWEIVALGSGVTLIAFFSPCPHLSAWTIGCALFIFTIGTPIATASWAELIPELRWVVAALAAVLVLQIVIALVQTTTC